MVVSINDLIQAGKYVNTIAGIFLWFFGVIGSLSILIIFTSKRQLRGTASSQYIIATSIFDLTFLSIALGYRILTDGFGVQGSIGLFIYSLPVCRIRNYITGVTNFATIYSKALCAFDQWASTSRSSHIRRFSSIKWARIFLTGSTLIWILDNIPQLLYNDTIKSPSGAMACVGTSTSLTYAYSYFLLPVIYFFIPLVVLTFFGYFTYVHVSQLGQGTSQQGHLHRIERQITSFIIAQTLVCVITSLPYGLQYLYTGVTLNQTKDSYRLALEALIQHVVRLNVYLSSAAPFYIYVCLSSEIRRIVIDLICCRRTRNNQIVPSYTNNKTIIETHKLRTVTISVIKPI